MKYCRFANNLETKQENQKMLKAFGINWDKGHFSEHWSKKICDNNEGLPNINVPCSQIVKKKEKHVKPCFKNKQIKKSSPSKEKFDDRLNFLFQKSSQTKAKEIISALLPEKMRNI